jgi:hypothetical protein
VDESTLNRVSMPAGFHAAVGESAGERLTIMDAVTPAA